MHYWREHARAGQQPRAHHEVILATLRSRRTAEALLSPRTAYWRAIQLASNLASSGLERPERD
jgi:hypothetical protein